MRAFIQEDQDSDSIDLVKYLVLLWHWAWLIVLVVIIAAVGTYFVNKQILPVYQAQTAVLVDMASSNSSADYGFVLLNSELTQTYSQMMTRSPVLDEVATRLGLAKVDPQAITAQPLSNTQLINIFVESSDPNLAADIANTLVIVFADQVHSLQTTRYSASEQSLQAQMADIENKIKAANEQLTTITDPTEKDRLETMVANYSQTYASLLQSYEQVRLAEAQTLSSIVQIDPANIPTVPVRPKTFQNVIIAALVSAILACGLIIGIDLLNDTVKTPEEITKKLGLPVLGVISHYKNKNGIPITESEPHSPTSEAFRTLRTNVKYAGAGLVKHIHSIMVISAMPSEGKTDVIINLGVVLAQSGQRVLLIDADLRRPTIHSRLELNNLVGLSNFFLSPEGQKERFFQKTRIVRLSALTAGNSPPNPSEILSSPLIGTILEKLKTNYDILLIDTPPCLVVSDAAEMLPYVEGVLLVIKPGSTRLAPLQRLIKQLHQQNANLLGAVLNDINMRNSSYGYYYKQYKYSNSHWQNGNSKQRKKEISSRSNQTPGGRSEKNFLRRIIQLFSHLYM